jgi:hypothetical protein
VPNNERLVKPTAVISPKCIGLLIKHSVRDAEQQVAHNDSGCPLLEIEPGA